jgi:hypothetical protein
MEANPAQLGKPQTRYCAGTSISLELIVEVGVISPCFIVMSLTQFQARFGQALP